MTVPDAEVFARLVIAGDLAAIFQRLDEREEQDADDVAYKWLSVALDFGHAEADAYLDDLMEASSLRYDDDQAVVGGVHFDLAARTWPASRVCRATSPAARPT